MTSAIAEAAHTTAADLVADFFTEAEPTQAYAKVGVMGGQGSGKTYTACLLALGLRALLVEKGVPGAAEMPVAFLETSEFGVDFIKPMFDAAGVKLLWRRTAALSDFVAGMQQAAARGAILIVDGVTGFWDQWIADNKTALGRENLLDEDWGPIKAAWRNAMEVFKACRAHVILCGRAGWDYARFENEATGRMELERVGVKMRAEGDTGYEPSLLIHMRALTDTSNPIIPRVYRLATVMKDRSQAIDGQSFENPTFADFRPHFERLSLGGQHKPIDPGRNSAWMVKDPRSGKAWHEEKLAVLGEIEAALNAKYPGQTGDARAARVNLMRDYFGTMARERLETLPLSMLRKGYEALYRGAFGLAPPVPGVPDIERAANPMAELAAEFDRPAADSPAPAVPTGPDGKPLDPKGKPDGEINKILEEWKKNPAEVAEAKAAAEKPAEPEPGPARPVTRPARAPAAAAPTNGEAAAPAVKRGRGRPPGSKNKAKATADAVAAAPETPVADAPVAAAPEPAPAPENAVASPDAPAPDAPAAPPPDTDGGPNPDYVPPVDSRAADDDKAQAVATAEARGRETLAAVTAPADAPAAPVKRGRGRPPGSKNKAKGEAATPAPEPKPAEAAAAPAAETPARPARPSNVPDVGTWAGFMAAAPAAAKRHKITGERFANGINRTIHVAKLSATAVEKMPREFLLDFFEAIESGRWNPEAGTLAAEPAAAV